jgi:hypothetical protein
MYANINHVLSMKRVGQSFYILGRFTFYFKHFPSKPLLLQSIFFIYCQFSSTWQWENEHNATLNWSEMNNPKQTEHGTV